MSSVFASQELVTKSDLRRELKEMELHLVKWVVGTGMAIVGILFTLLRVMPH
ncbi:MAG: hypothetical protein HQL64_07010 [Magnetococcales bacterium]|nr:hypothetical protein [Magnetococcales bacterium]